MTAKRKKPAIRREEILQAAATLAEEHGYLNVTRDEIAAAIGVSGPTVQYHFKTMQQLRVALMRHAVKQRNAVIVVQGLVNKDPHAMGADAELKELARGSV